MPTTVEPSSDYLVRLHRYRIMRRLLGSAFILLAVVFAFQFLNGESRTGAYVVSATPNWSEPSDVYRWVRAKVLGAAWRMRAGANGALPPGEFGLIFKVALFAVAAAVFLRVPQRT